MLYSLLMLVMQCLNKFNSLIFIAHNKTEQKEHNCFTIEATMLNLKEEQSLDTLMHATSC